MDKDNSQIEKLFFIDDVKKGLDFDSYETPYAAYTYGVRMTKAEFNKVMDHGFYPNTTNNRTYNTGFLKAFLGKD